jgi:hypothetical protein
MPDSRDAAPALGSTSAVLIFVLTLIAFVVESELTQVSGGTLGAFLVADVSLQHVQTTLDYRHPFFLL